MRRAEAEATYYDDDDDDETHQNQGVHVIISPEFCVPRALNLTIIKKVMTLSRGNFTVIDSDQGITLLKVRGPFPSYRGRRVIYNTTAGAGSAPILTLRQKVLSQHTRWKVFRGESTEEEDLIFSTKQQSSWFFQRGKKLDVFLAGNTREEVCDFKLEASRNDKSCSIYAAGSSSSNSLLGQMQKKHGFRTILDTQDEFFVTVAPCMDYAFVVALIIILDEMHGDQLATSQMN